MVNTTNFLDLWDLLVNEVAGSPLLFVFLATVVILYFATKSKLPNSATIMMFVLFLISVSAFTSNVWLIIILLPVFGFVGWMFSRLATRG